MKKILHYIPAFEIGGIESLFLNIIKNSKSKKIEFILLCETKLSENIKNILNKENVKFYEVTSPKKNILKNILEIIRILKNGGYDIVHIHSFASRILITLFSYLLGVKKIILHAHSTSFNDKRHEKKRKVLIFLSKKLSNKLIACSLEAGKFMFGKKTNFQVIPNGIVANEFIFNSDIREKYRNEYELEKNQLVIGHIGRFTYAKNQEFIIEVIKNLKEKKSNLKLILVGDGPDFIKITEKVKKYNLEKDVIFMGARTDISEILSMIDVFIMPSFFEGLSLGLLEVQASGLPAVISDTINIKNIVNTNLKTLSLDDSIEIWCKEILNLVNKINVEERVKLNKNIEESNYSITKTVEELEKIYLR